MANFEFATAARIVFGAGALKQIGALASEYGQRALLVVGGSVGRAESLLGYLSAAGLEVTVFSVQHEPTIALAQAGREAALSSRAQMVVGFGGGSALDAAKAIAALATNPGDPLDYLEVIGKAQPLTRAPLPILAIPTTAGTGSEVTRNAVLASPEAQVKVSMRHLLMLPRVALIDPELTYGLPAPITASTGMDALTQNIEPYTCNAPNPIVDALAAQGIQRAARSLRRAYEQPHDVQAREDMALASLLGGLSLANAKLGAVHGFAAPIGGMFSVPHGAVCAALLPHVMRANIEAAQEAQRQDIVERYVQVARWLTDDPQASAQNGVDWVLALSQVLAIPPLSAYGIGEAHIDELVDKAARASSMKGNALVLSALRLRAILEAAL
ncbi:MAG: iron-containing alcohol dehydrogenase [Anaerolineae bacterium]|nr:iron-containing alcohol dehydrogenase [Anaerolineae bacterium]MDW8173170.1 iron-containing alcohol dehydrogenase [Anaerolineae bacterium]